MTNEIQDNFAGKHGGPILCKNVQPWKIPGVTHEDLIKDLMGCILSLWKNYRDKFNASYTQYDAISDAYTNGILKAIEKDKKAPTCAGNIIKCQCCKKSYKAPEEMPGDTIANLIFEKAPPDRLPKRRKIKTTCTECGHDNIQTIEKTVFSTLVYHYIRGAIQKGIRESKSNAVSIENSEDKQGIIESISANKEEDEKTGLPQEIIEIISEAMETLSEKQRYVLAMRYGIGGIYTNTVEKEMTCPHCVRQYQNMNKKSKQTTKKPDPFIIIIDYGISKNTVICPICRLEIDVDMSMNQTDIAKHLGITKQRICSTLRSITNKISGNINELDPDYPKWKKLTNKLIKLMEDHGISESSTT